MSSFAGFFQQSMSNVARWFLRNPVLGTFLETGGALFDDAAESMSQGVKLSQPLRCDSSALPILSKDRRTPLYSTEVESSKRSRLADFKNRSRQRGSHRGEMNNSAIYFQNAIVPTMRIVHQMGDGSRATWHTRLGTAAGVNAGHYIQSAKNPSNWNYDGQSSKWSRFWFILYAPPSFVDPSHYDDGSVYDGGTVYDGLATDVALDLIAMVRDRKAGYSRLAAYIIATDPASFDPTATAVTNSDGTTTLPVGNWRTPIDSMGHHTRLQSAVFIYEDNP